MAGGVLLSDTAHDLLKNRREIEVVSLGRYRLKNVGRPLELFGVCAEGIVVPDPRALEGKGEQFASLPGNLPDQVSPLMGRSADLASLVALVRDHRVVTISGPGGVGKTRLIVEVGHALAPEFMDGVAFATFADVTEATGFLPALAAALDVKESEERTLGDGIAALIGDRKALLLLDNLEQIVPAAPDVARLVDACPQLRIVTTSRTPLRITAEREYPLAPLAVPPASDLEPAESLSDYPAVALFIERAKAAKGTFALTSGNAAAVAAVCRRLDGLPLALELAAARLRMLSPEALLERLDRAPGVLVAGPRDRPERQQTLRATIDWSHALLTEAEQRLFRRMAIFVGGASFADVEAVCADPGESGLDDLESLIDKALVQLDRQSGRLRLLQTIGEYASERLDASGERDEVARRHARRYAQFAREIRDGIEGTDQIMSVERGIVEEGNLQAALDTLLTAARQGERASCEEGLQLCGDVWMYWHIRGKNLTAREYATSFIDADSSAAATLGRAGALITAGLGSWMVGQFERANEEWAEAYGIAADLVAGRELCIGAMCRALGLLGLDLEVGLQWARDGIDRSRALGFSWALGIASTVEGMLRAQGGDLETAHTRYAEALEIQERLGDREGAGMSLGGLAEVASARDDMAGALELYDRSLAAFEAIGDRGEEARILSETAWMHMRNDDPALARRYFFESVKAHDDIGSVRGVGLALVGLAATEAVEGRPRKAVQIAAAAEVYAQQDGIAVVYSDATPGRAFVEQARGWLAAEDVARATEIGRKLTIKQALDLARSPV